MDIGQTSNELTHNVVFETDNEGNDKTFITVIGSASQVFRDAEKAVLRSAIKKGATRGRPMDLKNDRDIDEHLENIEREEIALATAAIVGWQGLTKDDKPFTFSKENAKALVAGNKLVRDRVLAAARSASNFLKR